MEVPEKDERKVDFEEEVVDLTDLTDLLDEDTAVFSDFPDLPDLVEAPDELGPVLFFSTNLSCLDWWAFGAPAFALVGI